MTESVRRYIGELVDRVLSVVTAFACRNAIVVVLAAVGLAIGSVLFIANNLRFNTDTADMIADTLQWRQDYIQYKQAFPQYIDNLVVVVDGATPDLAQDASRALADALAPSPLFIEVFAPESSDYFRRQQLLFLDLDELESLVDRLASVQPFLGLMGANPDLTGLADTLRLAVEADESAGEIDLEKALELLAESIEQSRNASAVPMSWQELMYGDSVPADRTRSVIILRPKLDFGQIFPAEAHIALVRELTETLGLTPEAGVTVRLTGGVALSYEELGSVTRGAKAGGLLALFLVTVFLLVGLRSLLLPLVAVFCLVLGVIYTAGFATWAIGELNMISVAFLLLYIGLGVDFAIHYCLRFQEAWGEESKRQAIATGRHQGRSFGDALYCHNSDRLLRLCPDRLRWCRSARHHFRYRHVH